MYMKKSMSLNFDKQFSITLYGQIFHVQVEGTYERSEYDSNVFYSTIDHVILEDTDGNAVEACHDFYDELMEDVIDREYEPDLW